MGRERRLGEIPSGVPDDNEQNPAKLDDTSTAQIGSPPAFSPCDADSTVTPSITVPAPGTSKGEAGPSLKEASSYIEKEAYSTRVDRALKVRPCRRLTVETSGLLRCLLTSVEIC